MQRLVLGVLLAAGWLALAAGPAAACIWDSETPHHEKQFKSNYLDAPAAPPETSLPPLLGYVAIGAGVVLLLAGVVVGFVRGGRRPAPASQNQAGEGQA